jgi:hypothetical protein
LSSPERAQPVWVNLVALFDRALRPRQPWRG